MQEQHTAEGGGSKTSSHRHLPPLAVLPNSVDWFLIQCLGFHPSGGGGLLSLQHNITGRQWLIYNSIWTKYPRWNGIAHTTTVSTQLCTSHFSLSIPSAVSCSTWLLSENWTNIRIFCQAGIFVYLQRGVHERERDQTSAGISGCRCQIRARFGIHELLVRYIKIDKEKKERNLTGSIFQGGLFV